MTTPDPTPRRAAVSGRRRAIRLTLLILAVVVLTALAASFQLRGR